MRQRCRFGVAAAVVLCSAATPLNLCGAVWQAGDLVTHRQDIWGDPVEPAGALLATHFDSVYFSAGGVMAVGGQRTMTFSSAAMIQRYLPSSGPPAPLNASLDDPTSSASGQFGGEVVALKLNVDYSDAGHLTGNSGLRFGDLLVHNYAPIPAVNGRTVRQFLAEVNTALGGGSVGYTVSQANALAIQMNASFGGGLVGQFSQDHLRRPQIAGDLNGDGFVGIADLNIVLGDWNRTIPPADPLADPSGDGFVGIADLNVVLSNWNAGTPPGKQAAVDMPEPGAAMALLVGVPVLMRRRG